MYSMFFVFFPLRAPTLMNVQLFKLKWYVMPNKKWIFVQKTFWDFFLYKNKWTSHQPRCNWKHKSWHFKLYDKIFLHYWGPLMGSHQSVSQVFIDYCIICCILKYYKVSESGNTCWDSQRPFPWPDRKLALYSIVNYIECVVSDLMRLFSMLQYWDPGFQIFFVNRSAVLNYLPSLFILLNIVFSC